MSTKSLWRCGHSRPESVYNISRCVFQLSGDVRPPLSGVLGDHFVFPAPFQTRQFCSLEGISETAGTHGGSISSVFTTHAHCSYGWNLESLGVDFWRGLFAHRGLPQLHRSSDAMAQPRSLQLEGSPGLGDVTRCGHDGCIDSRPGEQCAMPATGLWAECQSQWHINWLKLEAVFLALKVFRLQLDQWHLYKQAVNLWWVDCHFLSFRAEHIPGLLNYGADMLSRRVEVAHQVSLDDLDPQWERDVYMP